MPTETQCPSCDTKLKVPDERIGQKVRCPRCQEVFTANAPDLEDEPRGIGPSNERKESPRPWSSSYRPEERQPDDPDREEDESPRRSRQEEEYSDAPARSRRPAEDDDEEYERPARSRRRDEEEDESAPRQRRRRHDPKAAARRIAEAEARAGVPNPFAYTALGLGIAALPLAFCCGLFGLPVGVVAIVFGIVALRKPYGQGFAWAGIACGGVSLLLAIGSFVLGRVLDTAQ
jgi:predicted Zn finger-like uncharacterized protein